MPNHITNGVTISHEDTKKIKDLQKKVVIEMDEEDLDGKPTGEKYTTFDFNAIIPMPESLQITSGSSTDLGMACFVQSKFDQYKNYGWFDDRYGKPTTPEELRKELEKTEEGRENIKLGRQAIENIEKYGHKDWYDWSNANWGTKWNAYSFSLVGEDENSFSVQFDTAWAPPTPIFEKLVDMGFNVGAVSIDEDSGVEPYYFGDFDMGGYWYVSRELEFER